MFEVVRDRPTPLARLIPVFLVLAGLVPAVGCGADAVERRGSIYELKADPTPENLERIRVLLVDPERDVRATALNALVGLEVEDAAELALTGLEDPDPFVRATAAKLLGDIGDPAHAPSLAGCLAQDPDVMARQRAAEALGVVGGTVALAALARGLEDPMDRVRMASVEGLRQRDPHYAKTALVRLLREDSAWEVRARVARALGLTGAADVRAALETALEDPNEFVRSAAATALVTHEEIRLRQVATEPEGS